MSHLIKVEQSLLAVYPKHITDSTFVENFANYGGAVYADYNGGGVFIDDSTFSNNLAMNGSAVFNYATIVPLTISNSKFTGNIASDNKGNAISNDGLLVLSNNEINTESADIYSDEGSYNLK